MHLALVTAKHVDPARTDDAVLSAALEAEGHRFDWHAWDAPGVRWQDYDRVVLRSCWDYHRHLPRFAAWLDSLGEGGARLVNPLSLVRENLHKRYLLALAAAGVPVPPLRLVARGSRVELATVQAELGSTELIVKPAVSGSAWRTLRVTADGAAAAQGEFAALVAERDALVQRFVPEISAGEYSLMFFGGRYSHAVLKTPAPGEFRCQAEYGGRVAAVTPPAGLRATAARALALFGTPAYARLDLVISGGTPMVMEVELIEPVLFFAQHRDAASDMLEALAA